MNISIGIKKKIVVSVYHVEVISNLSLLTVCHAYLANSMKELVLMEEVVSQFHVNPNKLEIKMVSVLTVHPSKFQILIKQNVLSLNAHQME